MPGMALVSPATEDLIRPGPGKFFQLQLDCVQSVFSGD